MESIIHSVMDELSQWHATNVDVTPDTSFDDLVMDSLDCVEFFMEMESRLGVQIDDNLLDGIKTPRDLAAALQTGLQSRH